MDQGILKEIRTHSQKFTNNPNEKFLLMTLGSQAKLENDNRSINVKKGLRTRCEMGLWVYPIRNCLGEEGGIRTLSVHPSNSPLSYSISILNSPEPSMTIRITTSSNIVLAKL